MRATLSLAVSLLNATVHAQGQWQADQHHGHQAHDKPAALSRRDAGAHAASAAGASSRDILGGADTPSTARSLRSSCAVAASKAMRARIA